jgi:hypothetical protein
MIFFLCNKLLLFSVTVGKPFSLSLKFGFFTRKFSVVGLFLWNFVGVVFFCFEAGSHYVAQVCHPPASAPWVLGLQACTTVPHIRCWFQSCIQVFIWQEHLYLGHMSKAVIMQEHLVLAVLDSFVPSPEDRPHSKCLL